MRKVLHWLSGLVLAALVVVAILAVGMRITGESRGILGFRLYYVATGSMEPTLQVGDVVLCRELSAEQIHMGDILVYNGTEGELAGKTITHRVTEEPVSTDGEYHIQTQGDARGTIPDPLVSGSQVIGVVVTKLRIITQLYHFFITPWGLLAIAVPLVWTLLSEVRTLFSLVKEEKNNHAES